MAGLKSIQEVVNDPQLKLTQAKDVRWLSHEKAVRNLRQCLPSVLTSLERERNDAQAHGLAVFVKDSFLLHLFTLMMFINMLMKLTPPPKFLFWGKHRNDERGWHKPQDFDFEIGHLKRA